MPITSTPAIAVSQRSSFNVTVPTRRLVTRDSAIRALRLARRMAASLGARERPTPEYYGNEVTIRGQQAGDLIRSALTNENPCMVARIGHTEMKTVLRHVKLKYRGAWRCAVRYVLGRDKEFWWDEALRTELEYSSGFFPTNYESIHRFCEGFLSDLHEVDILGSWLAGEAQLSGYFPHATTVPLSDLEPFQHSVPWSHALAGRRVLVIHPFETSIRRQYAKRKLLFDNPNLLPDFELITYRAVQSLGGGASGVGSWFDALDMMSEQIARIEFDIALIGAGAYGLPLAAVVKRMRRKAVHLGGALQLLFGIRGKRWERRPFYQSLMNEYWVRPLPEETPISHSAVDEGSSYW